MRVAFNFGEIPLKLFNDLLHVWITIRHRGWLTYKFVITWHCVPADQKKSLFYRPHKNIFYFTVNQRIIFLRVIQK